MIETHFEATFDTSDLRRTQNDQSNTTDAMKIDERHDEICSFINLEITRLQEKAELAGYKGIGEYLAVREREMRRNPYE